jgi:cysteine-rich repeat protein
MQRPFSKYQLCLVVALAASLGACGIGDGSSAQDAASVSGTCGNGVLDPGEQCDDGNVVSLDGCSATCTFEQIHRINALSLLYATDAYCPTNAIGASVGSVAQGQVQSAITATIKSGSVSELFEVSGLTDLTGAGSQSMALGSMSGTPLNSGTPYDGTNDLDWWYVASASTVGTNHVPLDSISGTVTGGAMSVGPGNITLPLDLGGGAASLSLSSVVAKGTLGAASAPTVATAAAPPGHLASEHDAPGLTTFASLSGGEMCGNVSAASLAGLKVPPALQSGSTACSQGYGAANSMLDVFVGGCNVIFFTAVTATQPDQVVAGAPPAGAGGPYHLTQDQNHVVNGCTDSSGASVTLGACLSAAAYSAALQFTTDRVIVKSVQ